MSLTLVAGSVAPLVSLAEIRAQCRLSDDETDEDALLMGYQRAAAAWIEQQTGTALLTSAWEYRIPGFPCGYAPSIAVPLGPLQSVEQVSYIDAVGATQVLSAVAWQVTGGKIWPAHGTSWPATRQPSDVVVGFTVGYGADWNHVPEPLRQATMMLAAYWHDMRVAATAGDPDPAVPFGVPELIAPYRVWAF